MPEHGVFRTKPQLVIDMFTEQLATGTPFRYLCADSSHGRDPHLRAFCHERKISYVMAVSADLPLTAVRGEAELAGHVLDRLLALGQAGIWERRSCGTGAKGLRVYDWTAMAVAVAGQTPAPGHAHTLLIRRSVSAPVEVEFFLAHPRAGTPVPELIDTAGMRWQIEENNEHGKDLLGLPQYQARKWTPWHRHVTIAMLALAFLAAMRAALPADRAADRAAGEGKDRLLLEAPAG